MADADENPNSDVIALLCVGDVAELNEGHVSPLTPVFGQPLIHHMIKSLERAGISKFCIGVDNVPGALLHYRDEAVSAGLDVQFVRDASAVAEHYGDDTRILVLQADTLWKPQLVLEFLHRPDAVIATVEERPENQLFERIDLNHRWGGLAVLKASTLIALTDLPEGWDMASALLRQAIQDAVPMVSVKQASLQTGDVRKLRLAADIGEVQTALNIDHRHAVNDVETALFSNPIKRLLPHIWTVSWGRQLVEWLLPAGAAFALLLAVADFPLVAATLAILSVFANSLRRAAQGAEYRPDKLDALAFASWGLLAATLFIVLNGAPTDTLDAVFLTLLLLGLTIIGHRRAKTQLPGGAFCFLTPLSIALGLFIGGLIGAFTLAAKLLILADVANQMRVAFWPSGKKTGGD